MNSSVLFLIVIGLIFNTCRSDTGTCFGVDISAEDDFNYLDVADKIWYVHILILNDIGKFITIGKIIYKLDATRRNVLGYYFGRSMMSGYCETVLYHIVENGNNRPCKTGKEVYPSNDHFFFHLPMINDLAAIDDPDVNFIATFIDRTKERVLFYTCYDVEGNSSTCNTPAAFGLTTHKRLKEGEKGAFEEKIKAFGGRLPPEGLPNYEIDAPFENDCKDPTAEV